MGFILFLIASLLYPILTIINIFFVLAKYRNKNSFFKTINEYFRQTALDIDRYGNHNFRTLWNATMITNEGYQFGNIVETISSVLGKNQLNGTLSKTGLTLVKILDLLEENHCINAIMEDNTVEFSDN